MEPGAANVRVMLENSTSFPPGISITTADGSMVAGAGPPLRVNVAVPFTRNPLAIGVTSASTRVMWWVWAPLALGSKFPLFLVRTQPSDSSMLSSAENSAWSTSQFHFKDQGPRISYGPVADVCGE